MTMLETVEEPIEPATLSELGGDTKPTSRTKLILRRLRGTPRFWVGAIMLGLIVLFALVGNLFNVYSITDQDPMALNQAPSAQHWFGTDTIGQDLYAQTISGLRKSLLIGIIVGPCATLLAAVLGATAGYRGGRVESIIVWVTNLFLALPSFILLMLISPIFAKLSWVFIAVVLVFTSWMVMAQVVKNQTKSFRDQEFVKAARYMGSSTLSVVRRHIIPNVASILIIDATLGIVNAITAETALSFFNLGVQPPQVSLGSLLSDGAFAAVTRPWLFAFPAFFLVATLFSLGLIGDALRDANDPRSGVVSD